MDSRRPWVGHQAKICMTSVMGRRALWLLVLLALLLVTPLRPAPGEPLGTQTDLERLRMEVDALRAR
jgi:hypothetical protein